MKQLFIVISALLILLAISGPVSADDTWTCTFDFRVDDYGWQPVTISWATGGTQTHWEDDIGWLPGLSNDGIAEGIRIDVDFETSSTLTFVGVSGVLDGDPPPPQGGWEGAVWCLNTGCSSELARNNTAGATNFGHSYYWAEETFSPTFTSYLQYFVLTGRPAFHQPEFIVEQIFLGGTGDKPFASCIQNENEQWIRPFSPEDEDPSWSLWDYNLIQALDSDYFGDLPIPFTTSDVLHEIFNLDWECCEFPIEFHPDAIKHLATPDLNMVFAASNEIGAPVMAATDGTVVNIQKLTQDNCADFIEPLVPNQTACWFKIPAVIGGTSNPLAELYYNIDLTRSYIVTLQIDSNLFLDYLVDDPSVQLGDTIQGGCILGKSVEIIAAPELALESVAGGLSLGLSLSGAPSAAISGAGSLGFISQPVTKGMTFVLEYELVLGFAILSHELRPNLTLYSSPLVACNANPAYRSCAGDPELRNPDQWTESGGPVQWLYPGVILFPNARIDMQLPLVPENSYSFNVEARLIEMGNRPEITIQIGSEIVTTSITSGLDIARQYFIPAAVREPDVGTFYTVAIINSGDSAFKVTSACVTEGDPDLTPNSCYFFNPLFDLGGTGWTASEDVAFQSEFGVARVPSGETLAQNAHLFPNEDDSPHDYVLIVDTTLWRTSEFVPAPGDFTSTLVLEYDWPDGSGFIPMIYDNAALAVLTTTAYFGDLNMTSYNAKFETIITVTEETQGDLVLMPTITTTEDGVLGLSIHSVCLVGPFPQQASGQGFTEPFEKSCHVIAPPTDEQLSSWIGYLWARLDNFFQCQLMNVLNRIYKTAVDAYNLMGWLGRWQHSFLTYGTDWFAKQFLPWLNGHFRNIASGNLTYVQAGEGAGFWDVLLAVINSIVAPIINLIVGLINQVATLLLTVISGLVTIVFGLITQVLGLLNIVLSLLGGIITSYHTAVPATIPGAPNCADPQSSGFCVANWIMENTIFSGPGAAIIPIIIAIGSVLFILWAIGEIKKAVVEAAGVS